MYLNTECWLHKLFYRKELLHGEGIICLLGKPFRSESGIMIQVFDFWFWIMLSKIGKWKGLFILLLNIFYTIQICNILTVFMVKFVNLKAVPFTCKNLGSCGNELIYLKLFVMH